MPSGSLISDPEIWSRDDLGAYAGLYESGPALLNDYTLMSGVCVIPVAEEPPEDPEELKTWSPVIKLQLHAPYRIRNAKYIARKNNSPPVLPSPGDTGKFIFLGGSVSFLNAPNSASNFDWSCNAAYSYVENCVSRTLDGFVLGTIPFQLMSQTQNQQAAGGSPTIPYGAISEAGLDAKVGWLQSATGPTYYNTPSYFPGLFFNDGLMNADLGAVPTQFSVSLQT